MNSDVFFTIGRLHDVCQDYASVVSESRVVLSDGCSSSKLTDIGARLLCRAVVRLKGVAPSLAPVICKKNLEEFDLPVECLDATLLTLDVREDLVRALVTGDGLVVGRKRAGGYTALLSEFPSGAPRYASYDLVPERRALYLQEFGTFWKVSLFEGSCPLGEETILLEDSPLVPYSFSFPLAEYDLVLLLSDGALSFRRPLGVNGATEAVPVQEVIEEMLQVKGFAGQFITRRARKFLKGAASKGWTHDDDFSVAAIYLGEL